MTQIGDYGSLLIKNGVKVYGLEMGSKLSFINGCYKLVRILKEERPDVVQTWMVHADLLGGLAAKITGVPLIIWGVRTTDYRQETPGTRVVRWLCAKISSVIPDKIVCVAHASLQASVMGGYDSSKLVTIHNGFNVPALRSRLGCGKAVRQRLKFSEAEIVVGCLGRFNRAKDHKNFVRAAGKLAAEFPSCRFLMVGRDLTPKNVILMKWLEATGVSNRFIAVGEQDDPIMYLDAMDVFVLPSSSEGFPNVLAEAMAIGLPCVTTDVGDASYLLGDTGLVVPPRDPILLSEAISRLIKMPVHHRRQLGERASNRVATEFSIAAFAKKHEAIYSLRPSANCVI